LPDVGAAHENNGLGGGCGSQGPSVVSFFSRWRKRRGRMLGERERGDEETRSRSSSERGDLDHSRVSCLTCDAARAGGRAEKHLSSFTLVLSSEVTINAGSGK
jgi:hypothetical protein